MNGSIFPIYIFKKALLIFLLSFSARAMDFKPPDEGMISCIQHSTGGFLESDGNNVWLRPGDEDNPHQHFAFHPVEGQENLYLIQHRASRNFLSYGLSCWNNKRSVKCDPLEVAPCRQQFLFHPTEGREFRLENQLLRRFLASAVGQIFGGESNPKGSVRYIEGKKLNQKLHLSGMWSLIFPSCVCMFIAEQVNLEYLSLKESDIEFQQVTFPKEKTSLFKRVEEDKREEWRAITHVWSIQDGPGKNFITYGLGLDGVELPFIESLIEGVASCDQFEKFENMSLSKGTLINRYEEEKEFPGPINYLVQREGKATSVLGGKGVEVEGSFKITFSIEGEGSCLNLQGEVREKTPLSAKSVYTLMKDSGYGGTYTKDPEKELISIDIFGSVKAHNIYKYKLTSNMNTL